MPTDKQEIELKFDITPELAADILARSDFADSVISRRLVSTYFDTPDHALLGAGYTLRVRHEDGRWVQTLKSSRAGDGAVRDEWSLPICRGAPDLAALPSHAAAAALAGGVLEAIFVVEVERRSVMIDASRCRVEISLDVGAVRCAGRSMPIGEVELEFKSGRRKAFFDFAANFRHRHGLRPSFDSKAARGFALGAGNARARRYQAPHIVSGMSAGQAFQAAAREALHQIAANAEALRQSPPSRAADPEIVHQLRVGLRRLRSLVRVFKPIVDDDRTPVIQADLRRIARVLGPAREADVVLAGAFAEAAWGEAHDAVRKAFGRRLRAARTAAYARARAAIVDEGFSALLMNTLVWIESGSWISARAGAARISDAPIMEFAAEALDKSRRRLLRRARHFDTLQPDARHDLRISAKTLRYTIEGLGPLFGDHPKRRRRFITALKTALDALGELNDLAAGPPGGGGWPEPVLAWRDARHAKAETASARELRRLAEAKPFWPAG